MVGALLPGHKTLAMSAEEMGARAQQLRNHAYAMSGEVVSKHVVPSAPAITSVVVGGLVAWRGSAGAVRYTIERYDAASKQWLIVCNKCATDADDPWVDPHPSPGGAQYRITPVQRGRCPRANVATALGFSRRRRGGNSVGQKELG